MTGVSDEVLAFARQEYQYGFSTDLDTESVPKGLSEDVIRLISAKKGEPDWLVEWRLRRLPVLDHAGGAAVAERALRADRLSGHRLLRRPETQGGAGQPGRG